MFTTTAFHCHWCCNKLKNNNQYSKITIDSHNWPSSQIPSSSKQAALMVKQNKAKVSTNKWVFLLNVIASGMGLDGYWSASSSAITAGMAIREACWILGKQAISPLPVWTEPRKNISVSPVSAQLKRVCHSQTSQTGLSLRLLWQ